MASTMRFATVLRLFVGILAMEEHLIDEAIKLFLVRKALPNPPPERHEGGSRRVGQRPQIKGVDLCVAAELPEVGVYER